MPETLLEWNVDTWKQAWTPQVDNFSKELSDFLSDEKLNNKEQISNFLITNSDLKNWFEDYLKTANLRQKIKCKKELQNCSTEEEIKSIILENIPEWYTVWGDELWDNMDKIENIEDKDFINTKEQADQKTKQAAQKTERDLKRWENLDEHEVLRKAIEERDKLVAKYQEQNLDAKTNQNSENYEAVKTQLENNWILNQLRQNHNEQFIDDYILVQATLLELKSNPISYEQSDISFFDKVVKNLNNSCNIPDTNLSSFSSENISQTRTELFHSEVWNDSLIKAKKSNLESRNYSEMLPEMWNEEMFKKYGQFLQWDLKRCWDEYKSNYLWFVEKINSINAKKSRWEDLVSEDQSFLSLEWAIKWMKEQIDNKTKDMVEELCIISQIKWMYMCIWEWNNFDLNKAKEIQNENWILTLRWHIDWVDFAIRQDTNDPEARLQTSQKLAKSTDGNVFSIGWKDNFIDSNFILPSQNEIFESIAATVQSDKSFSESQDQSEYLENLQTNIMWKMEEKFKDTEYVHHYMQWEIGWEKAINETLTLITEKSPSIINNETLMKNISQDTNKDLFDFIKILKFNIDNSTNTEKNHLNQCITKILEITNNYANNNWTEFSASFKYPPIIENYLKNESWLNGWNENSRLSSLSDLFKYYSENSKDARLNVEWNNWTHSKMIINDLYRDLFESSSGESLVSQTRTTKIENESADNYLASAIEDFPFSPEIPSIV